MLFDCVTCSFLLIALLTLNVDAAAVLKEQESSDETSSLPRYDHVRGSIESGAYDVDAVASNMLGNGPIANDWDAIAVNRLEKVNELFKEIHKTDNRAFTHFKSDIPLRIDPPAKYCSVGMTLEAYLVDPGLQFLKDGLMSLVFNTSAGSSATYYGLLKSSGCKEKDIVEVRKFEGIPLNTSVPLRKVDGHESQSGYVTIKAEDVNFTFHVPGGEGLPSINEDVADAVSKYFREHYKDTTIYNLGQVSYHSPTPDFLTPTYFDFLVDQVQNEGSIVTMLYLYIKTRASDQSKIPVTFKRPNFPLLPDSHDSTLIVSNRIYMEHIVKPILAQGGRVTPTVEAKNRNLPGGDRYEITGGGFVDLSNAKMTFPTSCSRSYAEGQPICLTSNGNSQKMGPGLAFNRFPTDTKSLKMVFHKSVENFNYVDGSGVICACKTVPQLYLGYVQNITHEVFPTNFTIYSKFGAMSTSLQDKPEDPDYEQVPSWLKSVRNFFGATAVYNPQDSINQLASYFQEQLAQASKEKLASFDTFRLQALLYPDKRVYNYTDIRVTGDLVIFADLKGKF